MNKTTLIFPAGMPRGLDYLEQCLREQRSVIGASSLDYDVSRDRYSSWVQLPYVTDPKFDDALFDTVVKFNITEIYTPNAIVWNHLNQTLKQQLLHVTLINEAPFDEILNQYRSAMQQARFINSNPMPLASNNFQRPSLSEIDLSALCRHANQIPGMCDGDKLLALCNIARYAVAGDVVEIGSWWGKSAFILAKLAQAYDLGNLLCVDPWDNAHLIQNEAKVDQCSAQLDAEEALAIFKINLLPYNQNNINYLRMTSVEAEKTYASTRDLDTDEFGTTTYRGEISILHIDGNHTFEAASADIASWSCHVTPGGWIIIDDYIWPYGDGPKRVGDIFLEENQSKIEAAFVQGTALFIQLSSI